MRLAIVSSVLVTLAATNTSAGRVLTSLTSGASYDFVIVGGGTAGSVLASRLSEIPSVKVLVIEAGASPDGNLATEVPFLGTSLPGSSIDWNYTTTPQPGLNGRSIELARGKVLGGSSVMNLMTWNRCANDLYDHWATLLGDSGWSWANIQQFYLKTSRLVAPADGHNTTGQVIPSAHGNGPVEVSVAGFSQSLDNVMINASQQVGGIWAFNEDINNGNSLGTTWMQSSVGEGLRSHAASAYLEPASNRSNLDILINTQVTRLLNAGHPGGQPSMRIVEFAQNTNGPRQTVTASKEVLIAAGVIGSPQLLQLSGIGSKPLLKSVGIHTLVDSPDIGTGFQDHPLIPMWFTTTSQSTWDPVLQDTDVFNDDLQQWLSNRTGLFVDTPANTQNFLRIPANDSIFKLAPDPSPGPQSPHLETIFVNAFAPFGQPPPASGRFMTVLAAVVSPTSSGTVLVNSSNPFAPPLIDLALLSTPFDLAAATKALRTVLRFISAAPAFQGLGLAPWGTLANATASDTALKAYARSNAQTVNHLQGTVRMSRTNARGGALDSELRVKGVQGVRVVDASVFPSIASCHIQAVVYTVAERASDLIKKQYKLS
ncbi:aryl-alcohol oxidase-like protein [Trametopsis cervina]|nr:aryl-alcohol oxidase-like protein [Trametopsis cervina]